MLPADFDVPREDSRDSVRTEPRDFGVFDSDSSLLFVSGNDGNSELAGWDVLVVSCDARRMPLSSARILSIASFKLLSAAIALSSNDWALSSVSLQYQEPQFSVFSI